ncbi:cell wall-binding repeat-containing protein [Priestia flexa]|uniref:cell wall-binding repeat-containing protein n=1 Tax=Priestia flexa TaxID=86664 RepID=UPI002E1AA770|nr:cell wall-binding repeat-containing protein [Priestia flexa]
MKKILVSIFIFILTLCGLNVLNTHATQAAENSYLRIEGKNRVLTSVQVSKRGWPKGLEDSEKSVIIARSDIPADALSAASLSGVKNIPILLVNPNYDSISSEVIGEIKRLGATKAYVLGSEKALSTRTIEYYLKYYGNVEIQRIAGPTRFETAEKINEVAGTSTKTKAILVNGDTIVDALSAASEAAINKTPIYLTKKDRLPVQLPNTVKEVVIYGSENVVSKEIISQLTKQNKRVTRVEGPDRYSTNVAALKASNIDFKNTILVRGTSVSQTNEEYPDAVTASGLANKLHARVVLTPPDNTNKTIKNYLSANRLPTYVLGASITLSNDVLQGYGYDALVTKSILSKESISKGHLPLVNVHMGTYYKDVISKLGDPNEIYGDNSTIPRMTYYYDSNSITVSFHDAEKLSRISINQKRIRLTEADLIEALGKWDRSRYDDDFPGAHYVGYYMGDYRLGAIIDTDSKKVTNLKMYLPGSYESFVYDTDYYNGESY